MGAGNEPGDEQPGMRSTIPTFAWPYGARLGAPARPRQFIVPLTRAQSTRLWRLDNPKKTRRRRLRGWWANIERTRMAARALRDGLFAALRLK